jgi:hypothetical protein
MLALLLVYSLGFFATLVYCQLVISQPKTFELLYLGYGLPVLVLGVILATIFWPITVLIMINQTTRRRF